MRAVRSSADHVRTRPSAVSQHLAKLWAARLVTVRREGNKVFYTTYDEHVRLLVEAALLHTEHVTPIP
jgi:ArsR family transcriptional regulator, lead/cadmium/zinc/bismuth-responsive transcriptional repressor